MKILQISPQQPSINSGGGMGVFQTLMSLRDNKYEVDYVGPEITEDFIKEKYESCYELQQDLNVFRRVFNLIKGITNSRYKAWNNLAIDIEQYELIVLDFTKLNYVLRRISNKSFLVKVHNVEYDYSLNDYKKNRSLSKWILSQFSFRQEKEILDRADAILVLTENDKSRLLELYGNKIESKIVLNPVSVLPNKVSKREKKSVLRLLITGSLWYGENVDGLLWFLDNVFCNLNDVVEMTVAGARPSDDLKLKLKKYSNIELIDTPVSMEPYFMECDLFVSPIFGGAGMKVKVAEALSYGKPVIGTDYALLGYTITEGYDSFRANSGEEFIQQINDIVNMDNKKWNNICDKAYELYLTHYSMHNSAIQWKNAIERIDYVNRYKLINHYEEVN